MHRLGVVRRAEWRRVALFAALVMLLTTLPYLVAWRVADDDWIFSGMIFGVDDGNSYLAKMRQGAQGEWLFTLRYTHEPHDGALLLLHYILLGKLAALLADASGLGLTSALIVTYHAARIVFGFTLLLLSYRVAAVFLPRPHTRMLALVLIALGGGLGWLLVLMGQSDLLGSVPLGFFVPEAYSFLVLIAVPHIALARTALLLGLLVFFRALLEPDIPRMWLRWAVPAGALWAVMGLVVPFYIAVLYAVLGCWGLAAWLRLRRFPWGLFWRAVSAALVSLPVLLYSAFVFLTNDAMRQWARQNTLESPHLLHYVMGYIAYVVPAVVALRWAWRRGGHSRVELAYVLLIAWTLAALLLVYLPVSVQRRLAEGVIVPLSILAAAGLRLWFTGRREWRWARNVLLLLVLPTSMILLLGAIVSAAQPARPLFQPAADVRAMERLNAVAPADAVVLSTQDTGNYLPVYSDLIAYVGHGPETLHATSKIARADRFFRGELSSAERRDLLDVVDYVFFGEHEQELATDVPPAWTEGLWLVEGFGADDPVVVYEVLHDDE